MSILGLVLAGGKSSRFGRDKALELYQDKTFLETAVDLLDKVGLPPIVVTRKVVDYSFLKCPILKDTFEDMGPLGGLYTALSAFPNTHFLVLTCDMPALEPFVLIDLLARRESADITMFSYQSALQPFPGIYSPALLNSIRQRIVTGKLSMHGLIEDISNKSVLPWQGDIGAFLNVNHKEDVSLIGSASRPESHFRRVHKISPAQPNGAVRSVHKALFVTDPTLLCGGEEILLVNLLARLPI